MRKSLVGLPLLANVLYFPCVFHSHSFLSFIAESGATPVNMLDWQAQQKALKEQDRMSKTETAKMLHNYRGDTDEISSKLSTLKQEDRKSKQEAAQLLHNYRGTIVEGATKSPKRPDGKHVPSAGLDPKVDQRSGEESVAALAAGFDQNGAQEVEFSSQQQDSSSSSPVMVDTPMPPFESMPPPPPIVEQETSTDELVGTVTEGKQKDEDWVSVESSSLPSPEKIEDMLAVAASNDSGEDTISRAVTEVADNLDDDDMDDSEETVLTEARVHASLSGGGHVSLRLDVEFSFGLVSTDTTPNTDKYMKAVAYIAQSLFAENRPAGTGGHAIYNADFEPFIRFVEDDTSFVAGPGAKRQVVHASLPMFIINWAEATSTRDGVKTVLKNAIQDGTFSRLAFEAAS